MTMFRRKHYHKIAEILGSMSRIIPDQHIQTMTEEFGKVLESDNELFDFKRFQSTVTRHREGTDRRPQP